MLPVVEAAAAARRGDCTRVLPLVSPALVSEADPYRDESRIVWPETVLLTCIPTQGATTLPVPADMWRHLAVIDADDRERPALPPVDEALPQEPSPNTEVTHDLWLRLCTVDDARADKNPKQAIDRLVSAWGLAAGDARMTTTVYLTLRRNGLSEDEALALAAASTLVPRANAQSKTVEEHLKAAGITATGWKIIQREAERLRS